MSADRTQRNCASNSIPEPTGSQAREASSGVYWLIPLPGSYRVEKTARDTVLPRRKPGEGLIGPFINFLAADDWIKAKHRY